jgi:outer membrane lipoprotein-sorting protein
VVKKNLEKDLMPVAVSFLYGKGDLKAEFNAEVDRTGKYGEKDDVVLRLTPKQPSAQYKNLFLVVSPKDFHVSQSVIVDSSNNVNHFRFYGPDFEKSIKDSYFEFDERSVKNYRVIDADASKDGIAGTAAPGSGSAPAPAPKAPAPAAPGTKLPTPPAPRP